MLVKYCKWCGMEITLENRAIKNTKWGIHVRNECKPCRSKRNVKYKQLTTEQKSVPCLYCATPCIKKSSKAYCSIKCTVLGTVIQENDCWIWQGHKRDGYGKMHVNGKEVFVHRVSYELFKEQIQEGKLILHSCHNPSCVNPNHLRQGTDLDNTFDKLDARRQVSGWNSNCALLKEKDVVQIRKLFADGMSRTELMKKFDVGRDCITSIVSRKTWKYI